ncbi:MAG: translation initiation factor IF-2 [Dehalococcoidia bacterium]|nr:MAG: translation initiation factor IF-2 [Dehalococcoidia bacterium]
MAEAEKQVTAGSELPRLELPRTISVRQLADMLKSTPVDIIKQLMRQGLMANINQVIDYEMAARVAAGLGFDVHPQAQEARKASVISEIKKQQQLAEESGNLKPRPPVVTIMGHVDHGKTRILDAIRQSNVMEGEAGGITQHIGAYQVEVKGQKITFLDTPGHEAFTAMRARGAQVTDITVLVVAADDGVMPQTLEAIAHARAAGVPIIVAINKMDKPGVNTDVVKKQLAEAGLVIEEWGGETIAVPTSAKTRQGIEELLENILLVAEMENLRADPAVPAKGVVIEARMDKTKGPLATVLVHDGTLRTGDMVVVGTTSGKVKAMFNDAGKQLRKAVPATPVVILGLHSVPQVGDSLTVVTGERQARVLEEEHMKETAQVAKPVNLSNLFDQINAGQVKELPVVLKVDVQGSMEPIKNSLERLSTSEIKVNIVHAASGNVNENDVNLAIASKGIVIAFNTGVESNAQKLADSESIDIRQYLIIYELIDDVERALKGLREPEFKEVIDGRAQVKEVFPGAKKTQIAGLYVTEGKIRRDSQVRVKRGDKVVADTTVLSLRRFKENVREVATGYECGIGLNNFNSFQVADVLEFYRKEKVAI